MHKLPVDLHHFRTVDGREVDLLLEREDGFIAIECKVAEKVNSGDMRQMNKLQEFLDKPLLLCLVVSFDNHPRRFDEGPVPMWNVAAHQLMGIA
jgi:hypothetical protein